MLSVVIATLERPHLLRRVLERLERQREADDAFEVVVGADAAERDMGAVHAAAAGWSFPVRVVQAATPGVSAARNRAWPEARHPVVLFIGDDMLPTPDLVARHLAHHRRHPEAEHAMIGHVEWARELRTTPLMRWLDQGIQFDFRTISGTHAGWWHFIAANGSVKRSLLERVGGFDEAFRFGYEELELAYRLHQHGLRLHYDTAAVVEHLHPPTLDAWKQRMRAVATAERQFVRKHPDMPPYFLPLFERAASQPQVSHRVAQLAARVPRGLPGIGRRASSRVDTWFAQQLAPAFLAAWRDAE